jgi:UDPglucose 6-dehydrogenase
VTVLDIDPARLETLSRDEAPFFEPGLEDLMRESRENGNLSFGLVEDVDRIEGVAMIAVGTPSTPTGSADMRYVRSAIDTIAEKGEPGTVVVMKSTVPPGTGRKLAARLAPHGIEYASNPEFLREGCAVEDWFETDRVVIGGTPEAVERVRPLYRNVDAPIVGCDVTSAEMIKYASNAFLATKISFINEIAVLCDLMGATVDDVARGVGMDTRIGPAFLNAGIGYGGSCFPKDTRALDFMATLNGYDFHLLRSVIDVNSRQRLLPVRALRQHVGTLEGKRIAVLGLTFKPNTDDTREAPAPEIIELLSAEGADVVGYNPIPVDVAELPASVASIEEAVEAADAAIIATEWEEIVRADWSSLVASMKGDGIVFDGRNCLDPVEIRDAGGTYIGVGRPNP